MDHFLIMWASPLTILVAVAALFVWATVGKIDVEEK
ncbi:cytochrome bd oxidase small subunit CydS [Exiguobacterium flavidum]